MKFVTNILSRRAFVALAAASMLAGVMHSAPVSAADVTIPIIVKDTTSFYWQSFMSGARKAANRYLKPAPNAARCLTDDRYK